MYVRAFLLISWLAAPSVGGCSDVCPGCDQDDTTGGAPAGGAASGSGGLAAASGGGGNGESVGGSAGGQGGAGGAEPSCDPACDVGECVDGHCVVPILNMQGEGARMVVGPEYIGLTLFVVSVSSLGSAAVHRVTTANLVAPSIGAEASITEQPGFLLPLAYNEVLYSRVAGGIWRCLFADKIESACTPWLANADAAGLVSSPLAAFEQLYVDRGTGQVVGVANQLETPLDPPLIEGASAGAVVSTGSALFVAHGVGMISRANLSPSGVSAITALDVSGQVADLAVVDGHVYFRAWSDSAAGFGVFRVSQDFSASSAVEPVCPELTGPQARSLTARDGVLYVDYALPDGSEAIAAVDVSGGPPSAQTCSDGPRYRGTVDGPVGPIVKLADALWFTQGTWLFSALP